MTNIEHAFDIVDGFSSGYSLSKRISDIESELKMKDIHGLKNYLAEKMLSNNVIEAALKIKQASGQIDIFIHAFGILVSLPQILEPDEKIIYLSLGAGNTGKKFDLETNKRVAEFKFIEWRGRDSMRQNNFFKDFFHLVEYETDKKRCLYVINEKYAIKFLNGERSINSVLGKNNMKRFNEEYGEKYKVVSQYYNDKKHLVQIIDLKDILPMFK